MVPEKSIAPEKAADAVAVLVELVDQNVAVSAPSVRAVVKCIGVLVGFCDLKDWESVKLGFQTLIKFSIDKRPKVRKCAQDCVMNVLKAFEYSTAIKKASKLVLSLFKSYMKVAVNISASSSDSKDDILSKPDHLEVLHMLNLLKHLLPYLSAEVRLKALLELQKLVTARFSALTRHIFDVIKAMFESLGADDLIPEADGLIKSLASYISVRGNPLDTVLSAAYLLKNSLNNIHAKESSIWTSHLSLVIDSLAGLLTSEATTAAQASKFLKELINCHIDVSNKLTTESQLVENEAACEMESTVKSTCAVFSNLLSSCGEVPNEHILAVISVLFLKLGEISHLHMKDIICKLADFMTNTSDTEHLQKCIGSATIAMGPEKLLDLLPISLNAEDLTCSNIWLIPILKNYVTGASLGFFIEHIVPLAVSFVRASHKVKKSVRQDLKAHARGLWGLLPAFCDHPINMHRNIKPLAKLLIPLLKEDSFMVQNIAIALQELVNQNKVVLSFGKDVGEFAKLPKMDEAKGSATNFEKKLSYSIKTADRNLRALASCSEKLLQSLTDVLFELPHEKRTYLKSAIGCLASISDSSVMEKIFISSLERFQLVDDSGDCGKLVNQSDGLVNKEEGISNSAGKDAERCVILELACSITEGASEDLVHRIFNLIKHAFQEADEISQCEAYLTLNKILEKHSWFCSSKFIEVMDLLVGLKSPVDIISFRSRFACFQTLLIHTIKILDEDKKSFLILNEIILTLKDG